MIKKGFNRGKQQWGCRERSREIDRKYLATEEGRETRRKYQATETGREAHRKSVRKYQATEKGREALRSAGRKYRAKYKDEIGGDKRAEDRRLRRLAAVCEEPNPRVPRQTRAIVMLAKHGSTSHERNAARKILRERGLI